MLSQNDPRWKAKKINSTTSTIGSYGCLITSLTHFLNKTGYDITPDAIAKDSDLFQGDMFQGWSLVEKKFPKLKYSWGVKCLKEPAPIEKIIRELKDGAFPIIMLDYSPREGVQTHYLAVIGYDNDGNLRVGDPWDGAEVWLDTRYGKQDEKYKILKVDVYQPVKDTAPTEWDRIKMFLENRKMNEGSVREAVGAWDERAGLQREVADLKEKYNKLVESCKAERESLTAQFDKTFKDRLAEETELLSARTLRAENALKSAEDRVLAAEKTTKDLQESIRLIYANSGAKTWLSYVLKKLFRVK